MISKGLAGEQTEAWLCDEAKKLVTKVVNEYEKEVAAGIGADGSSGDDPR